VNCLPAHQERYTRGVELFNREAFFDAHEILEDVWRAAPEAERKFLQGLIQAAVALHHHSRGNVVGCRSLLARAQRNLSGYPTHHLGLDVSAFVRTLMHWREALEADQAVPPLPKLEMRGL
jgi:predicted metal-dependent hydrolase